MRYIRTMSMSLSLGRIHCLRPSLTPPLASTGATTQASASPPNPHFAVADYLVQTCGLSSDQALRASKYIHHLKTPDKPDAVLQFLRQLGITESDIRTAVLRDARFLRSSVEKNWRPNVAKLQEVGISMDHISGIISGSPGIFVFNFVAKIDFWLGVLGSVENLFLVLKRNGALLHCNLEKVAVPNLSFLRDQCGLSAPQIVQLMKLDSRLITSRTETLKMKAKRAEDLGLARSSGMFLYALIAVSTLNRHLLDARLNNLKSLGFSQEEITTLVRKHPFVLKVSEEKIGRKIEFLRQEGGCQNLDLVQHPNLITYNLDNRMIPRNIVRKLLMSKGLQVANHKFVRFMVPAEKQFLDKYVLPYEHAIPGLHHAYANASTVKSGGSS